MAPARSTVIRGTVLTGGGEPLQGARVYFVRGPVPLPDVAALTAEDGSFALSAPAAGEYHIGASADGFSSAVVNANVVDAEGPNVTLHLEAQ